MTQKLAELFRTNHLNTHESIRKAVRNLVGPLTTSEIWNLFPDIATGDFRHGLPIRGSADEIATHALDVFGRQPTASRTDAALRIIQQHTEGEIYPGSKRDLGVED